jgi:hypothetical protein
MVREGEAMKKPADAGDAVRPAQPRNPMARALAKPQYRPRIKPDRRRNGGASIRIERLFSCHQAKQNTLTSLPTAAALSVPFNKTMTVNANGN